MDLKLYVITDKKLARGRNMVELCRAAIAGGATAIQLRSKEESCREALALGRELRALTRQTGTLFIVNDRVDLALILEADGVHLGQKDIPLKEAQKLLPPGRIVGISAETVAQAKAAEAEGASYLGVGPVFSTGTKPDAGKAIGLEKLAEICRSVTIPVVAIGGINRQNAADVIKCGAAGISVISAVIGAPDVKEAASSLFRELPGEGK
ncbi:MAG: thiamine phosphate synthase [Firmicutes bacterium]|nr:thiamine phosphate synthase [Bacillota bacterium]